MVKTTTHQRSEKMIRFIAAFCGLLALQLSLEQNLINPQKAIVLGYLLGFFIGFFK